MKPAARHKARKHTLQALYQSLINHDEINNILAQHLAAMNQEKVDAEYFRQLTSGILSGQDEVDAIFTPFINRSIHELTPIELSVLRLASFEMKHYLDIPYRVVLNEALELTKEFGTQEGFKFVNGVLDKVAKHIRVEEYNKQ